MRMFIVIIWLVAILLAVVESKSQDYKQTQNKIKAIYAFNFIKEVEKPFFKKENEISICLMVANGFYDELKKRTESKIVNGRSIKVNLIQNITECRDCDMIFIDEELEDKKFKRDENCGSFIVTIGFFDKSLSNVALVYEENKLQFGINMPLCEKLGYKIPSELASLSKQKIIDSK